MNAAEAEILQLTKYKPKQKYKCRNDYLICLLKEVDGLRMDVFEHLLSKQVYEWYTQAVPAFKAYKPLPDLPEVALEELRYPRDDEDYTPPEHPVPTPEEQRGNIKALIDAHEKADVALIELHEATKKIMPRRISKYRPTTPSEGARHYLFPEYDRYGQLKGTQREVAIKLFERGATMKEVRGVIGYSQYNLLGKMRKDGHQVTNTGGIIKLTHKDDAQIVKGETK